MAQTENQRQLAELRCQEFADFFITMTTPTDTWPAATDDDFVTAIGAAIEEMAKRQNKPGLLQVMAHELQDRIQTQLETK